MALVRSLYISGLYNIGDRPSETWGMAATSISNGQGCALKGWGAFPDVAR